MDNASKVSTPPWWQAVLIGRRPKRTAVRLVLLAMASFVFFKFVLLPERIDGGSMLPTYQANGFNFVNRLAYTWREPKRGDVVAIRLAGESIMYMKRIVGLPGETVAFSDGHLLIDGALLDESYVKLPCDWNRPPAKLGPDKYFVVGDNRSMPQEGHRFGAVPRHRIAGKVLL